MESQEYFAKRVNKLSKAAKSKDLDKKEKSFKLSRKLDRKRKQLRNEGY